MKKTFDDVLAARSDPIVRFIGLGHAVFCPGGRLGRFDGSHQCRGGMRDVYDALMALLPCLLLGPGSI